jgi:hypothetical protein
MMIGILKMVVVGVCMTIFSLGTFGKWPVNSARNTENLQQRMTDCDRNIDQLIRLHDGDVEAVAWDRKVVEGDVKACLSELGTYFYATVARTKLKAKGVRSF